MAAPQLKAAQYSMKVVEGPEKGKRFAFTDTSMTVGRGLENGIVLLDPRCSRLHVQLEITPQGLKATNVSSQSVMTVNGREVTEALMGPGAVLGIGDSYLQFELSQLPQLAVSTTIAPNPLLKDNAFNIITPSSSESYRTSAPKKNVTFYIILGAIVLVGIFLFLSDAKKKRQREALKTEEVIEQEIQNAKIEVEKMLQEQIKLGKRSENYGEAQAAFIKGFRDYREGNFKRAISHFDAARALFPDHPLATRYRTLAAQKLDQLVQDTLREAKSAFERNQFQRSLAAYKQVRILLNDANNPTQKEAEIAIQKLEIIIRGAF